MGDIHARQNSPTCMCVVDAVDGSRYLYRKLQMLLPLGGPPMSEIGYEAK
jgi:hypothetical protein